mmetsp:Transcript_27185/g.57128  ORF Transcript_27185/g.57128 Transcript_27185/m.57128 type:complete len:209 (-) Transcript_27185:21-647(-)
MKTQVSNGWSAPSLDLMASTCATSPGFLAWLRMWCPLWAGWPWALCPRRLCSEWLCCFHPASSSRTQAWGSSLALEGLWAVLLSSPARRLKARTCLPGHGPPGDATELLVAQWVRFTERSRPCRIGTCGSSACIQMRRGKAWEQRCWQKSNRFRTAIGCPATWRQADGQMSRSTQRRASSWSEISWCSPKTSRDKSATGSTSMAACTP